MGFTPSLRRTRSRWVTIAVALVAALFASFLVSAPAHALADTGTGGQFVPLQQRIFDSRVTTWGNKVAAVTKGNWTSIPVAGSNGLPSDLGAVQVTLTEVNASGPGVVYADKTGVSTPNTSMPYLTWYDTNVSNTAILPVGSDGAIQVSTNVTSMNLTVDVQGYYTAGDPTAGGYVPLSTATRVFNSGGTRYATGQSVDVQIGGQAGVPANASSVMINITEANSNSGADGYLAFYPTGSTMPSAPSLNWTSGQNAEFTAPVKLGTDGKVTIRINRGGSVQLLVGIQGYFTATSGTAVLTPAHARVYDSRSTAPVAQVPAGGTRKIQVAGVAGVPVMGSGLTAAAVNIYILSGSTSGHVNVAADDAAMGDDAQQFYTNRITYGFTTVKLGADGGINLKNYASTPIDVLVDVEGWFTNPLAPQVSCQPGFEDDSWTVTLPSAPISCSISGNPASNSSDTLQYGVDLGEDAAPANIALSPSAATTVSVQVSPTPGTHEIWAATESSDGDSTETVYSFDLGDWTTDTFTAAPADGETTSLVPNLTTQLAGNYVLPNDAQLTYFVSTDAAGSNVIWNGAGDDSSGVQPVGLSAQTYYWWAVVTGSIRPDGTQGTVTTPI